MGKQLIISISFDSQPEIQCMPLVCHEPGLGLGLNGVTWCEQADALLYIDEHQEVVIKSTGGVCIEIERNGRKYVPEINHPTRVLVKDIIRIGATEPHTFEIRKIYVTKKPLKQLNRLSKIAMIACATSMVMTCSAACHRPAPQNATQTTQSEASSDLKESEEIAPQTSDEERELVQEYDENADVFLRQTAGVVVNQESSLIRHPEDFVDEMKTDVDKSHEAAPSDK